MNFMGDPFERTIVFRPGNPGFGLRQVGCDDAHGPDVGLDVLGRHALDLAGREGEVG